MAPKKRPPGARRRLKRLRNTRGGRPSFVRPREWAEQELIGVRGWLKRLKGEGREMYPEGWRRGQIRHYEKRARVLKGEIEAAKAAEKAAASDPDEPPNVA